MQPQRCFQINIKTVRKIDNTVLEKIYFHNKPQDEVQLLKAKLSEKNALTSYFFEES